MLFSCYLFLLVDDKRWFIVRLTASTHETFLATIQFYHLWYISSYSQVNEPLLFPVLVRGLWYLISIIYIFFSRKWSTRTKIGWPFSQREWWRDSSCCLVIDCHRTFKNNFQWPLRNYPPPTGMVRQLEAKIFEIRFLFYRETVLLLRVILIPHTRGK